MTALPSDFHLTEALRRENPDWSEFEIAGGVKAVKLFPRSSTVAHARTLAEFMKEPVDPLLVMAREICAKVADRFGKTSFSKGFRDGDIDSFPEVQFALECLRKVQEGKGKGE